MSRLGSLRRWTVHTVVAVAVIVLFAAGQARAGDPPAASVSSTVTVERPPGQIVLQEVSVDERGNIDVVVLDTRADDPGWSVRVVLRRPSPTGTLGLQTDVTGHTARFADGSGVVYAQQVIAGATVPPTARASLSTVLGAAPAGHGLGMARLHGAVTGTVEGVEATVTIV